MWIPAVAFLIIVQFREVKSFEVVLVNGSLTIVDLDKACQSSGFMIDERKKMEANTFTASFESTSSEIDTIFGVVLDTFCPYVGYYRVKETLKIDLTEPLTEIKPSKAPLKERSKVKNVSEPSEFESESTTVSTTLKAENYTPTITKSDIPLLNTRTNTTAMLLKTEPTVDIKETTPYMKPEISFTVENVTESLIPALELTSDVTIKDKNVTSTPIPKILTKSTVALSDSEPISKHREMTSDMKRKLLFVAENVTESITTKIDTNIISEFKVLSSTKITKKPTTISGHTDTNNKSISFNEFEKGTPTIKLSSETVTESFTIALKYVTEETGANFTKSERTGVLKDFVPTPKNVITNEKATLATTLVPKDDDKAATDNEVKGTSSANLLTETTSIDEERNKFITFLSPENNHTTNTDAVEYKTKYYDKTRHVYLNAIESSTFMSASGETDYELTWSSTAKTVDDDYDYGDDDETKIPNTAKNNSTRIYKHNAKSVNERRIVIVILFLSILLALVVMWTSQFIYTKRRGKYVLPQNLDNENIELGDNPE